ncbi:MAG: DUF393 domain-containing protein [Pseudobdellovibrio sp.]
MNQLTVYYDELCVLCSKEIHHYQRQTGSEKINFIDITASSFNAATEGVDPFQVHKVMHAKKPDGTLLTKVDAFIAIWQILPKYNWLYKLSKKPILKKMMDFGYIAFAEIRPYLPKKKMDLCADSPFCEIHTNKKE